MVQLTTVNAASGVHAGVTTLQLEGELDRTSVPSVRRALLQAVDKANDTGVTLDLALTRLDSAGAGLIAVLVRRGEARGVPVRVGHLSDPAKATLALMRLQEPVATKSSPAFSVERIGASGYATWQGLYDFLSLTADTIIWSVAGERRTKRVRKGALWTEANLIGVDAFGIVGLIAFLIGTVVALQSAAQLRQFGADIYVANLIGVSMTREMGPLMTAIIIAGRSGAAIAAEIATMTVNEEVDALRTMGLSPRRYIVVPKFQGITLTMPGLVVFADLLGILGGFMVAALYLGLGPGTFFGQLADSLMAKDVLMGVAKSIVFAWIIVLIAAHYGSQAYGGAESVGKATTTSVVASIFWVIVADAAFNILFYF